MRLLLLRHAKSSRPPGVTDHHRPLSKRGRKDCKRIGRFIFKHGLTPDQAIVSTASRTQETWYLVRRNFVKRVVCNSDKRAYDASPDDLRNIIRETSDTCKTLLVVGHNPALWKLALTLSSKAPAEPLSRLKMKFPTAGLVVIRFKGESWKEVGPKASALIQFVTPASLKKVKAH
jgi:phosphohistidine phosphatase